MSAQTAANSGLTPKAKPRGRPFRKGQSGNPSGRPKKDRELTAALERAVDKQALAERVVSLAMAGDSTLMKYIYDRIEGTPTQRIEFSIEDFIRRLRENHPSLDDDAANLIARRAQECWQRTG